MKLQHASTWETCIIIPSMSFVWMIHSGAWFLVQPFSFLLLFRRALRDCAGLKKKYIFMIVCLWIYMLYCCCCCYVLPSLLSKCLQNYLSYMAVSDWTAHPVISANCWQRNLYFHRLKVKSCTLKQRLWRAFPSRRRLLQPRRFLSTSSLTLTLDNEN